MAAEIPDFAREVATGKSLLVLSMGASIGALVGTELTEHQVDPIETVISTDHKAIERIKKADRTVVSLEKKAQHAHNVGAVAFLSRAHRADTKQIMAIRSSEPRAPSGVKKLEMQGGPMLVGALVCVAALSGWSRIKHRTLARQNALKT